MAYGDALDAALHSITAAYAK
ncbi:hypothetical protein MIC448_1310001 [Microbacterium sp. C448]|nr:hypothetical protein MIC448_1310001 [Microbacterium sp. C448]